MENTLQLITLDNYQPGHIEMFYGNDLTVLGTLGKESPKEGDRMAEFTINGNWKFVLTSDENDATYIGDYYETEQITPKIEAAIIDSVDAQTLYIDNKKYEIDWINNNWFEIFLYEYTEKNQSYDQINDGEMCENLVAPDEENMRKILQATIDDDDQPEEFIPIKPSPLP